MKNSFRKGLLVTLALSILLAASATVFSAENDTEVSDIYLEFAYWINLIDDDYVRTENYYFDIGENVPDELAYYLIRRHVDIKRFPEYASYMGLAFDIPYPIFAEMLDAELENHSDLKAYLTRRKYYNSENNTVFSGYEDGLYGFGRTVIVAIYSHGSYTYVDGMELVEEESQAAHSYGEYTLEGKKYVIAGKNQLVLKQYGDSYKIAAFRARDDLSIPKTGDPVHIAALALVISCAGLAVLIPGKKKARGCAPQ